ncbi:uncharacterized protein LOC129907099 [Episyrphus balteatus]|uniref:uncharacterized protein LOC129907099 n=1 Tax=Episyrphus balteatus TaxID=286459 RepID=UPI002485C407|nr:uncharacterized protein LOC129907099 [Episyrphus balteatus]
MSSSPIQTILKIEDLTSEDEASKLAKEVLSESEICSIDFDDDEQMQMITMDRTDSPPTTSFHKQESTQNKTFTEVLQSSENRDLKYCVKTKPVQFEAMANFMMAHPDFADGTLKFPDSRVKINDLWNELSDILNKNGPPTRGGEGWRKVWYDYKTHIRKKLRKNKTYYLQPRGLPKKFYPLSRLERRVANFMGYIPKETNGAVTSTLPSTLPSSMVEIPSTDNSSTVDETTKPIPSTVNSSTVDETTKASVLRSPEPTASHDVDEPNTPPSRYSPPLSKKYKKTLLQTQVDTQREYTKDSKKIMLEINDNLKGLLKYSIKSYELEQRKFELEKEKFLFKQKTEAQKHQTEMEKLQVQKDLLRLKQETAGLV